MESLVPACAAARGPTDGSAVAASTPAAWAVLSLQIAVTGEYCLVGEEEVVVGNLRAVERRQQLESMVVSVVAGGMESGPDADYATVRVVAPLDLKPKLVTMP